MGTIRKIVEYNLIPTFVKEKNISAFFEPNEVWKDIVVKMTDSVSNVTRNQMNATLTEIKNKSGINLDFNIPSTKQLGYDFDAIKIKKFRAGDHVLMAIHHYPEAKEIGELQYGVAFVELSEDDDEVNHICYYALVYDPGILEGKNYVILICYDNDEYSLASKGYGFSSLISLDDFVEEAVDLLQGNK